MSNPPIRIDRDTLKAYHDSNLWKDNDFYVSLLESFSMYPDDMFIRQYVQRLVLARQKHILANTFPKDGSVNVTITPIWSNLWQRVLRYLPWNHGPRIED
jgi:hypothetical protein